MLLQGNCLDKLKELEANSVDSIVTDPPYGISFMGKKWDYDVPAVNIWEECLRVLKPGGHLLAFAGTRTQHRMAVNIEDAGFEVRDLMAWTFGTGFPKSHNIGKAVDKLQGNEREVTGSMRTKDFANDGVFSMMNDGTSKAKDVQTTRGFSEWEGWGTALKPALEPITVARKPISEATIAANVLKHGTGGINIDACRVGDEGKFPANLLHDGSEAVDAVFPNGNSRLFYCAKASKKDREDGNNHPTVKPTDLMRYLVRLATPKGGTVLDPFMGSGSTGKAAALEGFNFVGVELDPEYFNLASERIKAAGGA